MNFYQNESSDAKWNAQRNLTGRTHYVDDDTLRSFHSRILSSHVVDNGLLFAIVESVALDCHNTRRGYRYVIFDVFGNTVERASLDDCYKSNAAAQKAMWAALNGMDAMTITAAAIDAQECGYAREIAQARADLAALSIKVAA